MENQIRLKWTSHLGTLLSVFDALLSTESLVDVTLACEGQYIRAHKMILSACSPYLQDLINVDVSKHPIFFLKDVKYIELKALIHFMYRGEVNIAQDDLPSFLAVAQALQIRGLEEVETENNSISNDTFILPNIGTETIVEPQLPLSPVVPDPVSPVATPRDSPKSRSSVRVQDHSFASQQSAPTPTSIPTATVPTSRPPAGKKSRAQTRLSSQNAQVKIKKSQIMDRDVQTFSSTVSTQGLNPIQTAFWPSTSSGQYESPGHSRSVRSHDTNSGHTGMAEDEAYAPAFKLEGTGGIEMDLEQEEVEPVEENSMSRSTFSQSWLPGDDDSSGMADNVGETAGGSGSRAARGEVRLRPRRKQRMAIVNKKAKGQFQCLNFNCTRVYENRKTMISHLRYECNRSPQFCCTKCDYKARQKGNVKRHMKRKH